MGQRGHLELPISIYGPHIRAIDVLNDCLNKLLQNIFAQRPLEASKPWLIFRRIRLLLMWY